MLSFTLKHFIAHASLQNPSQILTSKLLFEFSNHEISVIMSSVNLKSVKENILFLASRFSDCSTFNGTCKNHEFIPGEENIVMNYLSGDASKNLLIQQKETVLSIHHIMPRSFYACSYDSGTLVLETISVKIVIL